MDELANEMAAKARLAKSLEQAKEEAIARGEVVFEAEPEEALVEEVEVVEVEVVEPVEEEVEEVEEMQTKMVFGLKN
jgi:hypothetical protein